MQSERRIGAALAACALLTGLWLFVNADDTAQAGPNIHAPLSATAGHPYAGSAEDNGGPVEVEVLCNGVPVPGLVDIQMDGSENHFDFTIPESLHGQDIEIVATTPDGRQTKQTVHVN